MNSTDSGVSGSIAPDSGNVNEAPSQPSQPSQPTSTPPSNTKDSYTLSFVHEKYPNISCDKDGFLGHFVAVANKHGLPKDQAQAVFDSLMVYRDQETKSLQDVIKQTVSETKNITLKRVSDDLSASRASMEEQIAKDFPDRQQVIDHISAKAKAFGMEPDHISSITDKFGSDPNSLKFFKNFMSEHNAISKPVSAPNFSSSSSSDKPGVVGVSMRDLKSIL